jgi:hypothetical protein
MKEENGDQGVGATAFDLPNSQNPKPHAPIFHTKVVVPRPTNSAAKVVHGNEVMRQVLEAK